MNLKKQFYKDYYTGIDLKKAITDEAASAQENANTPKFKIANDALTNYTLKPAARDFLDFSRQTPGWAAKIQQIPLTTIYPGLFTGSGYTHETGNVGEMKLGFFFDHTTGLPILPGSSVKGTLRSTFPQFKPDSSDPLMPSAESLADPVKKGKANLIAALFSITRGDYQQVHLLELSIFEGLDYTGTILARNSTDEEIKKKTVYLPMNQRDVFLEAFIASGNTPGYILGTDSITPHGDNPLKNPKPLAFLKVLPEVTFMFQFMLQTTVLKDDFTVDAHRKSSAFEQILAIFGIGAKTNVGYGQFVNPGSDDVDETTVPDTPIVRKVKDAPDNYTGKLKVKETRLEAKVTIQGKPFSEVEVTVNGETYKVKTTGTCPEANTVCMVLVKEISPKSKKITLVSYDGILF